MADKFRSGDYYIICANTGWKIRKTDAVKQWDGAWVHRDHCDEVHPLEYPRRASRARPVRPDPSEPHDVFITNFDVPAVEVVMFTITAAAGSYLITGTDVTLTSTTVAGLNLDFTIAANSQYVPLVFYNWM